MIRRLKIFTVIVLILAVVQVATVLSRRHQDAIRGPIARKYFTQNVRRTGHAKSYLSFTTDGERLVLRLTWSSSVEYRKNRGSQSWVYGDISAGVSTYFRFAWMDAYAKAYDDNPRTAQVTVVFQDPNGAYLGEDKTPWGFI